MTLRWLRTLPAILLLACTGPTEPAATIPSAPTITGITYSDATLNIAFTRPDDDGGEPSVPLGNAIKDSMEGKLKDHTRDVLGVIYATRGATDASALETLASEFGDLLTRFGGATSTESQIVRA